MNDLTTEQIIEMGQMYFPEMDAEQILDAFEQFRKILPKGMSNLEIAQVIKMAVDERKNGKPNMSNLKDLFKNR